MSENGHKTQVIFRKLSSEVGSIISVLSDASLTTQTQISFSVYLQNSALNRSVLPDFRDKTRLDPTNGELGGATVQLTFLEQHKHFVLPNSSEFWSISADGNSELQSGGEGRRGGHSPGQNRQKNRWKVEFSPLNTTVPVHTHARTHERAHTHAL